MTEAEAIAAAERVLALINSTPGTPPKRSRNFDCEGSRPRDKRPNTTQECRT